MSSGLGIRSPLDYSVFVDAAGAWLLAAAIAFDRRVAVVLDGRTPGTDSKAASRP
jgi:hypothetical protein